MVKSIRETGSKIKKKERESELIQTATSMKETMSMIKEKVSEHTIGQMVISIKDSGRMASKRDTGYPHSRVMELYKKENIKETSNTVTIIKMEVMIATQVYSIKGRFMV